MIKMMLKATVSHMALRVGMAAWAYKARWATTADLVRTGRVSLDAPPPPSPLS